MGLYWNGKINPPIRILIVDDHEIVRKGIRALLATKRDIHVIAEETVHTHLSNILNKLHLASRTQAALYALKEGIASVDDIPATKND